MKHALVTLALIATTSISSAQTSTRIEILDVRCGSGLEVNFKETVSPGETHPHASYLEPGQRHTFSVLMANQTGYASGRPPCPFGDTLWITWEAK